MRARVVTALAVGLLSMVVYMATLAPGLTWAHQGADGGDLASAVAVGGIPHPPGYPTYVLLGRIFALLPVRDIAFRLNLMSAVCAAVTIGLLYLLLVVIAPPQMARADRAMQPPAHAAVRRDARATAEGVSAVVASLALAFSPLFWSQALITEVYALNALFVVALLLLALSGRRRLVWLGVGLGLGNHLSLALLAPALLILVNRPAPSRASASPLVSFAEWREWATDLLCLLAGLTVYLYLPLRAAANPLLNWGDPRTLDRFIWMITGAPYRIYMFALSPGELPGRLSAWAGLLLQQFGWPGAAMILLGLWDMLAASEKDRQTRRLAWGLLLIVVLYSVYALGYRTGDSYVYLIPVYVAAALWLGRGLVVTLRMARSWAERASGVAGAWRGAAPLLASAALLILPAAQLARNWQDMDLSGDSTASSYVERAVALLPAHALVVTASDEHTFALWYAQAVTGRSDLIVVDRDLTQFLWYREQIRSRAPDLADAGDNDVPAEYAPVLVQAARGTRSVFLADQNSSLLAVFAWQRRGDFYMLISDH